MKVLITDDNELQAELLRTIIEEDEDMEVVGVASDGFEAYAMIDNLNPDIVLLDMIMPGLDGMSLLEKYKTEHRGNSNRPLFIVVSAVGKNEVTESAFQKGADYYVMKPFNADVLRRRIKQIYDTNKFMMSMYETKEQAEQDLSVLSLEREVAGILRNLGMPVNVKGYKYLIDAIVFTCKDKEMLCGITKQLYPAVAKANKTTWFKVERDIRNAIETTWKRGNVEQINSMFVCSPNYKKGRPTNSEFIALLADKMEMDYGKVFTRENDR